MADTAVIVPMLFPTGSSDKNLVQQSCSRALPSRLVSWGYLSTTTDASESEGGSSPTGVAFGCEDGTIYILHSTPHPVVAQTHPPRSSGDSFATAPPEPSGRSRPTSPLRYGALGLAASRSASPSSRRSSFSPFHITQSRIVSAVSKEQAEAPKNYVDFDDEPDKLKGMLRGKCVKEKAVGDSLSPNTEKGALVDKSVPSPAGSLKMKAMSTASSSAVSLTSPPPSPGITLSVSQLSPEDVQLALKFHVFPPCYGPTHGIVDLKTYAKGEFIICLQQSGEISIFATVDGSCIASLSADDNLSPKDSAGSPAVWMWKTLMVASCGESNILLAFATRDETYSASQPLDVSDDDSDNQTRFVACVFHVPSSRDPDEPFLEVVGSGYLDGPFHGAGLHEQADGSLILSHISPSRRFILQSLSLSEVSLHEGDPTETDSPNVLPIPNPFKALTARSKEHLLNVDEDVRTRRLLLGKEIDIGDVAFDQQILGLRSITSATGSNIILWSSLRLSGFKWQGHELRSLFTHSLRGIEDVYWNDQHGFTVILHGQAQTFSLTAVDANNDEASIDVDYGICQLVHVKSVQTTALLTSGSRCITSGGDVLYTRVKDGRRLIDLTSFAGQTQTLWYASANQHSANSECFTSLLPIELNLILQGFGDGSLRRSSFPHMVSRQPRKPIVSSDAPLSGSITRLYAVENEQTKERFVIGGADDGSMAIWVLDTLKMCARWTIFTTPLDAVLQLREEGVGRLRGCILCMSRDGTIAVVAIDDFQLLFLVPASVAALTRICLGADNLLLIYADGRARLWDTKTHEFWRSMNVDKADELLRTGGWSEWTVDSMSLDSKMALSSLRNTCSDDAASALLLDLEALLRQCPLGPVTNGNKSGIIDPSRPLKLELLRTALSTLLTFGLNEEIDNLCHTRLGVDVSIGLSSGFTSRGSTSLFSEQNTKNLWSISPAASTVRALALISVLQMLTHDEELAPDVNTVMTYYVASLSQAVGTSYQFPSLLVLAQQWLSTSLAELRHAARVLFDSGVSWLSDQDTMQTVETWQQYLPSLQADGDKELNRSAVSLFICGFIAVEKYSLLPTSALTDIAKSISLYLHNETSPYRALAIDLCSRGFQVWQQHVDAVDMLRALFTLATATRKDAISVHNIGALARSAVLLIASENTPLFMTTLTIDILHPQSVQHRKSILQLVVFLIRKKPLVLYSNLPRLVEAVVKSLDPNLTASRDAVLDSATEILGHVVQTFPTVDFHMPTQRLVVGTSEGAVVMYDLKTATRLYVLEGHKRRTTACSFSPDGRRLVTVSLEESLVLVWKVGSSFTSFFNPGAPPRQGHGGSNPFKTLNFNVGDEAHMTLASTLDFVRFEWPAERSVRLKIRESVLTFST